MTKNKIKALKKECKEYTYRYKWRKWIDNYDIITCIKCILAESDNDKLATEMLIRLEVKIDEMTKKMGKSMPWKAFKILLNRLEKFSKY